MVFATGAWAVEASDPFFCCHNSLPAKNQNQQQTANKLFAYFLISIINEEALKIGL